MPELTDFSFSNWGNTTQPMVGKTPPRTQKPVERPVTQEQLKWLAHELGKGKWVSANKAGDLVAVPSRSSLGRTLGVDEEQERSEYRKLAGHFRSFVIGASKLIQESEKTDVRKEMVRQLEVVVNKVKGIRAFAEVGTPKEVEGQRGIRETPSQTKVREGVQAFEVVQRNQKCSENLFKLAQKLSGDPNHWSRDEFDQLQQEELRLFESNGNKLMPGQKARINFLRVLSEDHKQWFQDFRRESIKELYLDQPHFVASNDEHWAGFDAYNQKLVVDAMIDAARAPHGDIEEAYRRAVASF